MGDRRGVKRVLVGKPEGKRPLGTLRHRCEYNITIYLQEVVCRVMDGIDLAHNRDWWLDLVNAVLRLQVP
jgi:hypothetical protein